MADESNRLADLADSLEDFRANVPIDGDGFLTTPPGRIRAHLEARYGDFQRIYDWFIRTFSRDYAERFREVVRGPVEVADAWAQKWKTNWNAGTPQRHEAAAGWWDVCGALGIAVAWIREITSSGKTLPAEIERLRAALHDVAFFGTLLLRRIPPTPPGTADAYRDAWTKARAFIHAVPRHLYDAIEALRECGPGWDSVVHNDLDRIAPANTPTAEWGDVIARLGRFYHNTLNSRKLHATPVDTILAKNAEEESQRRERERRKNEADKRRVEMLNAFGELRSLTLDSFIRETGEDVDFDFYGRAAKPLPNSYWQWQAAEIVEACRSIDGWDSELEQYAAETDSQTESQRVALATIIQARTDGDEDRLLERLKILDLPFGSGLSKQVHRELWNGIPNALADIDRAKWAPVKGSTDFQNSPKEQRQTIPAAPAAVSGKPPQSTIPAEYRTRPLNKTEAAKYRIAHRDFSEMRRPDQSVGALMKNRKVLYEDAPGEYRKFIFDKRDFPAVEWLKISPNQ